MASASRFPKAPSWSSSNDRWGANPRLAVPATQQGVEQDRAEGRGTDAAHRELAELQGEVAGADHQGDRGDQHVAAVGEVDLVVDPDAGAGYRDQTEHDDADATHDRGGDGV